MKKKKKKKKRSQLPDTTAADAGDEIEIPETSPVRRKRGGFFWGLTLGFVATLIMVLGNDFGWNLFPAGPRSAATAAITESEAGLATASFVVTGALPPGAGIYVDGQIVEAISHDGAIKIEVPQTAAKVEIRGQSGTWWSTRLDGTAPDTLRPQLGGDLVVEVQRQGPRGTLYIDGFPCGDAPGSVDDVAPGWHLVSIREGDRVLFEDAVTVRPGEVTLCTVPALPPRGKGRLTIRSRHLAPDGFQEEQGNQVWIDGEIHGETPLEISLSAGFHSVRVEREGDQARVEVLYLEAGSSRYVNAEFGREERLTVSAVPPIQVQAETPLAIPVRVRAGDESVTLSEGHVYIVRPGQSKPVGIPLVSSGTDSDLWVAVLPEELLVTAGDLTGYAAFTDDRGRSGDSDLFQLRLHRK